MMTTAYIALGSNLGDRRSHLDGAIAALRQVDGVEVKRVSSYHETAPVGGPPGQGAYLNAAAELATSCSPEALLETLLEVERSFGRVRTQPNAPRTLDLDLLLYGDIVRSAPDPVVPHPRMQERSFVLDPLAELAPALRHPVFGVTIGRLAQNLKPSLALPLGGLRTLVTGSLKGIGWAIAKSFAEAGAWVILHGRQRRLGETYAVMEMLREHDVAVETMMAELTDPARVSELADESWRLWNGLDVLVCNAGADVLTGEAARWPFERKLEELWAVDVRATMQLSRDLGARMLERGCGSIITIGWDQAETGMEGDSGQLFAAVKNAVMGFTRSLALTLAPRVRVNCIAPGWIKTAWGETASESWQDRAKREAPLARWGTPEDVAGAARWLASRDASFVTGQVIRVNGGAVR